MRTITIKVSKAEQDYNLVTNLRNVAEEIDRKFSLDNIARVPDMDSAISEIHVQIQATRHLGEVAHFIKKTLDRYNLSNLAEVSKAC